MINIDKHIKHWQIGAQEDWTIGKQLVKENKVRHGLFFIHLALEKILKALVCKTTNDLALHLHNLASVGWVEARPRDFGLLGLLVTILYLN